MTNNQYIHINEAVKKRDKTRQTFYNYIHKGLVRTKKINNKVYLFQDDVEQLMNGFIPTSVKATEVEDTSDAQESFTSSTTKEKTPSVLPSELTRIQDDMTRLHKQYYSLKDDIMLEMKRTRQELILDTKNINYSHEQNILQTIEQKSKEIGINKISLVKKIKRLQLQSRKQLFRLGYCTFVLVNFMIITYMV